MKTRSRQLRTPRAHSTFNIEHSTFNIQHRKTKGSANRAPLKIQRKNPPTYERSPFSCSSWQSMQYGVQGTAERRLSPIVAPQFVQVPYAALSRRRKASSISMRRLRSPSDSEKFSSFE